MSAWRPDGSLVFVVGRKGEGHGEFTQPSRIHFAEDGGFTVQEPRRTTATSRAVLNSILPVRRQARDLPLGLLRHRPVLAALLAFAFASSQGTVPDSVLSVRDSAGVRITMSAVSDGGASTVCSLAETPDTRVTSPASGEWTLFLISDLDRMEDGRLVVVNRGSQELLMFGRDGEFLRSVGRRGEGPGEFMDPVELDFVAGDSIVVWDWGLGRIVLFGPDGSHGRSFRLQPPVPSPTGRVAVLGRHGIAIGNHDGRSLAPELTPQFLQVLRYDWGGTLLDTLATLPYGEMGKIDPESRRMNRPIFEARGVFSTHGDLLYTSDGSSPEVRVHRGDRIESIVRWDPGDRSVRKEDVEAYRAAWLELTGRSLVAFPAKDVFPAVKEVQIDPGGRVWIQPYPPAGCDRDRMVGLCGNGRVHLQPVRAEGPLGLSLRLFGSCRRAPGRDGRRVRRGKVVPPSQGVIRQLSVTSGPMTFGHAS